MSIKGTIVTIIISSAMVVLPLNVEAKFLYHATRRAAAKKIMTRGFALSKMNPRARFSKGVYLSESKKLALKEKPNANAIIRVRDTKLLRKKSVKTGRFTPQQLKKFSGDTNLRGNIRHGTPGGDLSKKMGKAAGRRGRVIVYPSARGKGENVFVPQKVYRKHRRIVKPVGIEQIGK